MAGIINTGSPYIGSVKRTNPIPLDSSGVIDSKKNAETYAKNANGEDVPYPGQIIVAEGIPYILKIDTSMPDESAKNIYHCYPDELGSKNDNDKRYVRKDIAETIKFLMTFLEGVNVKGVSTLEEIKLLKKIVSQNFSNGSTGFGIYQDEQNNYHLDIDFVNVRRKLTVEEIQVQRTYYVAGKQYNTPGGGIICSAVEDIGTAWRCRFKTTDADGRTVHCTFKKDDQAICETFNLEKREDGKFGNRYYWRLVVGTGDDYIDLLKTDCSGTDIPRAGDEIVQLGNRTDVTRQGANVLDSVTSGGPYIRIYQGINSYHLPQPKIDLNPTESIIKAKFISEATGKDIDNVLDDMKVNLDLIKSQTDKEYTLWFFDYVPTLANLPASEWTTNELKVMHEQDMFYNRTTGLAYRFEKSGNTWAWNNITDQQTIKALENASKAQDTADDKRRVFVEQPTTADAYDVGDMWVNATYPDIYESDSLVCKVGKAVGVAFNIEHWKPATRFTTAEIINLGDKILHKVSSNKEELDKAMVATDNIVKKITDELGLVNDSAKNSASYILQTKDKIASVVANFDDNGNVTNSSGLVTKGNMASMFTQYVDPKGEIVKKADIETFVRKNADGTLESGVKIEADEINFIGKTIINGKFIVDEAGNLALNDIVANNIKLSGNIFGKDAVLNDITANNLALSGSISGGNAILDGIKLENITANSGRIGGFRISDSGLTNSNDNGTFTNDAYVIFRNDKHQCFAGIGGNVLPASSGLRGVARFENEDDTDQWKLGANYACICSAKNAATNYALYLMNGVIGGMAVKVRQIDITTTLDHSDCWVSCYNKDTIKVYLPLNPQPGKMIYVMRVNHAQVNVDGNGKLIRYGTTKSSEAAINNDGEIDIYVYDGQFWMNGWFNY